MNGIYSGDGFSITAEPGVPLNCMCVIFNQCILVSFAHHVGPPDSLSRGFFRPYQIVLTLFNIIIEFIRVNSVDLYTFEGTNPNFRVGQLFIFVKNQNVFFARFKQNYIIGKNLLILIVQHCMPQGFQLARDPAKPGYFHENRPSNEAINEGLHSIGHLREYGDD